MTTTPVPATRRPPPRVGILVDTSRYAEHIRRALRALQCSTFVFSTVEELSGLGRRGLDFLLVEPPEGELVEVSVWIGEVQAAVPDTPLLSVFTGRNEVLDEARHVFRGSLRPSKRFFSELVKDLMKLLQLQAEPVIRFGEYEFRPDRRSVKFLDRSIVMSEPEFDVALELFFHAHRVVSIGQLRRLLPSRRGSALGWSDEALLRWIGALPWALEMQRCGWDLKTMGAETVTVGQLRGQKKASGKASGKAPGMRAAASPSTEGCGGDLTAQFAAGGISC